MDDFWSLVRYGGVLTIGFVVIWVMKQFDWMDKDGLIAVGISNSIAGIFKAAMLCFTDNGRQTSERTYNESESPSFLVSRLRGTRTPLIDAEKYPSAFVWAILAGFAAGVLTSYIW